MTAKELMTALIGAENTEKPTVDTCKHGDPDRLLKKVGVCLTATPDVLRACEAWGADLLITHECTYYDHHDVPREDPITKCKQELVESCSFTIWRFHDFIHHGIGNDGIHDGLIEKLALPGTFDGHRYFALETPVTPREIAKLLEERAGATHARITGLPDEPVKKISLYLGACGMQMDAFCSDDSELAIAGEQCEWRNVEQMRDAAQFGMRKTLILIGHGVSEAPGMEQLARKLSETYPEIESRFFDCGDIYSYVEQK